MRTFDRFLIITFLSCLAAGLSSAQVRSLKHDWLVFDQKSRQLFPFVKKNKENLPLHIQLNTSQYTGLYLYVKSQENISIYLENRFFTEISGGKAHYIPVDSFRTSKNTALLSFFGTYNSKLIDSVSIAYSPFILAFSASKTAGNIIRRDNSKSYFAILLLISGSIFVFFKSNYSKAFEQYLNIQEILFTNKAEPSDSRGSFEGYYIAFILVGSVFFALACSGLPLLAGRYVDTQSYKYYGSVFNIVLIAWFFYFLKYFVIQTVSWLFSIPKFASLHFKVFIKIALIWSFVLVLVNMLGQSEAGNFYNFLLRSFLFVSLFFLTLISLKITLLINQASRISTLYLISYLCITEWLPYFIILKLYMIYFY